MKKTFKRMMAMMLALVLVFSLIGYVPAEAATKKNYVKTLKVSKKSISVKAGKSKTLKATVKVKGSASKKIKISQSAASKKVATVKIVSTKNGVTQIKITGKSVKKKTKVTFTIKTKGKNKKSKTIKKKITVTVSPATSSSTTTVTTYTVTFKSNGGSTVASQKVVKGNTVTKPADPTRSGYVFLGWYTDSACTNAYNFSTKVTGNLILYAKWVSTSDNLYDDIIDLGDLENLESQGLIEVAYAEDGSITAIEGSFTDDTVNSSQDAADVLNKSSSLFGDAMEASAEDITVQTIEGEEDSESFYTYSPEVDGVPVEGSQVVIATDENGEITGLTSSYDDAIESVDTDAKISESEAQEQATNSLLEQEDIQSFLNKFVSDDMTEDEVQEVQNAFLDELHFTVRKVIFAASDNFTPFLSYVVHISSDEEEEEDVDLTETGTLDNTVVLDTLESQDTGGDDSSEIMPTIDDTYYVYANDSADGEEGDIAIVIDNLAAWVSATATAQDALGTDRTINMQYDEESDVFRMVDSKRNITTYTTDVSGLAFWKKYSLPGTIVTTSLDQGTYYIDQEAVSVQANMSEVYDFYKNTLNRDSFDGAGAAIKVSYDYGDDYANAYWSSTLQQMVYGSAGGFSSALDVAGHEFTHAVIGYVVGDGTNTTLTYYGESGALNESYADIMGALIENKSGTDRWLIGEDSDSAIRSLSDPSAYGQPEDYDDLYTGSDDNAGVHTNSGIFNYAAYKMMTDSRTSSISNSTWAKMFYRSMFRLTTDADFLAARYAVIASAKALGFTSSQVEAMEDAFDEVGIQEPDSIRIVLTWGESPSDLDSHLVGPTSSGDRFHVYFGDKTYTDSGSVVAELDYDDTNSYGPEITTIRTFIAGDYYFYVYDYSNGSSSSSTALARSEATVKVYVNSKLEKTYTVDGTSGGTYWNVCHINISDSGSISIQDLDEYSYSKTLS